MNPTQPQKTKLALALALAGALFAMTGTSRAQTEIYFENFDADVSGNWTVNPTPTGYHPADIYFDYSTVGIPAAPHSTNGTTRGLKLQANLDPANQFFGGVSVSPNDFGITENFEMHWDMWINYNAVGGGSTQIGGGGYGTSGTAPNSAGVADCIFVGASTDGGTGSDYRVYSPGKAVSYQGGCNILGGGFNCGESAFSTGDPSSGSVYASGESRDNGDAYYTSNFPEVNTAPTAQTNLYPAQAGLSTAPGTVAFKWRDVSIKKIANRITYRIDGVLIATIDAVDATIGECAPGCTPLTCPGEFNTVPNAFLGGSNIMFNQYDINSTASTYPDATNLLFSLIDNVRITNFPTVVTVTATNSNAKEQGTVPGTFTISRDSVGTELTIDFSLSGSATSNVDYTISAPGSVTLGVTDTSTNVTITPIDDSDVEVSETIILTLNDSTNFVGAGSAVVTIADNESPQLAITNLHTQMFERTNDYAKYRITRLGNTNAASFNVNLSFTGGATSNVDYYIDSVSFNPGDTTKTNTIYPLGDSLVEGNETVICSLAAAGGGEYTIGAEGTAGTVLIVNSTLAPEVVFFSDNFDTDTSGSWTTRYASQNGFEDYILNFNYDYSADGIPSAPHSSGDTRGLKVTVNKIDVTPLGASGINLYPNGQSFTGDFALRFDMYLFNGQGASATEYAMFGINHSGNKTNWFRSGGVGAGWNFDGLFFDIETDNGAPATDYAIYSAPTTTNNTPTTLAAATTSGLTGIFKRPPYSVAGIPSNTSTNPSPTWADVEVKQVGSVVTLSVNNTTILTYTNTGGFTNGNIMLGYDDAFDSVGPANAAVIYENVRVLSQTALAITGTHIVGSNLQIDFVDSSFGPWTLKSSTNLTSNSASSLTNTVTATFSTNGIGIFRATTPYNPTEFARLYRIQR